MKTRRAALIPVEPDDAAGDNAIFSQGEEGETSGLEEEPISSPLSKKMRMRGAKNDEQEGLSEEEEEEKCGSDDEDALLLKYMDETSDDPAVSLSCLLT